MAFFYLFPQQGAYSYKKEKRVECDSCGKKIIKNDDDDLGQQEPVTSEFAFIDVDAICPECEALMLDIING